MDVMGRKALTCPLLPVIDSTLPFPSLCGCSLRLSTTAILSTYSKYNSAITKMHLQTKYAFQMNYTEHTQTIAQ